jgi:hypothetical protein
LPGNALFVGAGGGAGAVTHRGVMRTGAAPGGLAGGPDPAGRREGPGGGGAPVPKWAPRPVEHTWARGFGSNPGLASFALWF